MVVPAPVVLTPAQIGRLANTQRMEWRLAQLLNMRAGSVMIFPLALSVTRDLSLTTKVPSLRMASTPHQQWGHRRWPRPTNPTVFLRALHAVRF